MTWDNAIAWLMLLAAALYLARKLGAWWLPQSGSCGGCHGCSAAKSPAVPMLQLVPLMTELSEASETTTREAETSR